MLRAHAMAYAEQRALETMDAAATVADVAVEAAAARASQAHHVLGLPAVLAAQRRGSSQASGGSSPREDTRSSLGDTTSSAEEEA